MMVDIKIIMMMIITIINNNNNNGIILTFNLKVSVYHISNEVTLRHLCVIQLITFLSVNVNTHKTFSPL